MKVLIVAKTRRGPGACVGGLSAEGRSVRLVAPDAAAHERAGLEYEVGEVWDIETAPDRQILPPHVENVIVLRASRLRRSQKILETIQRFLPPVSGGPDELFDGLTQATSAGGLYIAQRTGLPQRSTMFWRPDQPLVLDSAGKRIRYRYPTVDGGRTLTFVGFQEPVPELPAGTLLRVSLAHWWRPEDRPKEELRCFVQLSGWFTEKAGGGAQALRRGQTAAAAPATLPTSAESEASVRPAKPESTKALVPHSIQQQAAEILKRTFGLSRFLPIQSEVIDRLLQRQDTLAVMPTGGGKSLCYQLPSLVFDGLTVVVSPLVALMQDQVRQLRQLGVPAACLNHTVPLQQYTSIMSQVRQGRIRLLYFAPETLLRPETLLLLQQARLACLAIDEAHCISEWGHDFRPEYRRLDSVRRQFPNAVCLALTATATPRVREDIRRLLNIPAEGEFVASFDRPNLFLAVEPRRDALAQVLQFLHEHQNQSGIIYCGTRKQTDELCAALNANGRPALPYHAGLDDAARRTNQERFLQGEVRIMVATIAFGMGINQPNLRFILHAHLPQSLESYYQEVGRAGRDGLSADCLLLFHLQDVMIHRHFIESGAASERPARMARLQSLIRFAEAHSCRRKLLLAYFGERSRYRCDQCDNCAPRPARNPKAAAAPDVRDIVRPAVRRRCHEIGELFVSGHTLEQIAQRFRIEPGTVIQNLCHFHEAGGRLAPERLLASSRLSEPQRARVLAAFQKLGTDRLGPIRASLSGEVPYPELHLLRLLFLLTKSPMSRSQHSH